MYDLGAINSASKKASGKKKAQESTYKNKYEKAISLLRDFLEYQKEDTLKESAEYFFASIKIKSNRVEPYLYLSYIFYLFDENALAIEYIEKAKTIDPEKSSKFKDLQDILSV